MKNDDTILIPADPNDPEDFDVTKAAWERGLMGRRIRKMRNKLGLSQEEFGQTFGIPATSIRQYEIGRYMPPPAVRAYLKVIEAEPEICKRVMAG